MPNPVVHFEITGANGTALQGFYREPFDWKVTTDNEWRYGMVETGGEGGINGGIAGTHNGDAGRVTVYASVDDPQAYLDKAERLGATTPMPVTDMGDVVIAMFRDPAGNVTGIVKTAPDSVKRRAGDVSFRRRRNLGPSDLTFLRAEIPRCARNDTRAGRRQRTDVPVIRNLITSAATARAPRPPRLCSAFWPSASPRPGRV